MGIGISKLTVRESSNLPAAARPFSILPIPTAVGPDENSAVSLGGEAEKVIVSTQVCRKYWPITVSLNIYTQLYRMSHVYTTKIIKSDSALIFIQAKKKKNCMTGHKNTNEEKVQYNRESTMNPQSSLKHKIAQTLSLDISKK